jgi:tRNA A37 methylthiotransferase MiaB
LPESGVKEVVLTGVNIGDFGRPGSGSLFTLLNELEKKPILKGSGYHPLNPIF